MRFVLFFFIGLSLFAADPIGKVVAAQGTVIAKSGSSERNLTTNSDVFVKETIIVALDALAQIQFTDGGLINLIGGTEYRVNTYKYQKTFQKDQSSSELLKGGFRALSGSIGKNNPNNYEVKTPSATIGLRGTILEALILDAGLYVGVESGRVQVSNKSGSVLIGEGEKNQFVFVQNRNVPPELLLERPLELERSIFNPPTGGLSIDQVQTTRASQAPATAPVPPTQPAPSRPTTPTGGPEAPSISETPDEGGEGYQLAPSGGGASIQGGGC